MAQEEITQGRQKQRRRGTAPRSAVWEHFTRFVAADGKDKAQCKRCHLVLGAATKSGTSSLWGHVKICSERDGVRRELHQTQAVPPPPPLPFAFARSHSAEPSSNHGTGRKEEEEEEEEEEEASGDLARMIALNERDGVRRELHQTQAPLPPPPPPPPLPLPPFPFARSHLAETSSNHGTGRKEEEAAAAAANGDLARMIALNERDGVRPELHQTQAPLPLPLLPPPPLPLPPFPFARSHPAESSSNHGTGRKEEEEEAAAAAAANEDLARMIALNERDGVRRELHHTQAPPPPPLPPFPFARSCSAESSNHGTGLKEEEEAATVAAMGDLARMIALNERDGVHGELHQTQAPPPPLPPCAPSRSAELLNGETGFEAAAADAIKGDLARMIALNGYDPSVVEDGHFRSFVRRLNPAFKLPSRQAIEEMCDDIFDRTRKGLFSRLRHTSGRISIAIGKDEAMDGEGEVFYTSCHFIDNEWNLHRVVMDAYDHLPWPLVHGPLSGVPEIAPSFHDICSVAIDRVMDDIPAGIDGLDRVFMVARDKRDKPVLTKPNDYIKENYPSTHPGRRREVICDTYMDIVLNIIGRQLVLHPDLVTDMFYVHAIESEVQDLRLTRQGREHLLSYLGLDNPRADRDRWYSCYCSLEVLRSEGSCIIPGIDTELIQVLCNVWRTIYYAIKRISVSSTSTSNLCLAELFSLREVLQTEIATAGGHTADVLRKARDTLDKSLEDSYLVWSIPLILDPRYKLKYIEFNLRRSFSHERAAYYISEVTRNIRKLYSDYIQYDGGTSGTHSDVSKVMMTDGRVGKLEQAWDEHCRTHASMTPEVAISYQAWTELDRYLTDCLAPRTESFDILNWWKVHSLEYPTMARMARDALAMPTCSQLSAEQIAHMRSIIRGYSKDYYKHQVGLE